MNDAAKHTYDEGFITGALNGDTIREWWREHDNYRKRTMKIPGLVHYCSNFLLMEIKRTINNSTLSNAQFDLRGKKINGKVNGISTICWRKGAKLPSPSG